MSQFSLAKLFGITVRESATDGSDFTNPDADYRRLFLGEDGNLHLKDSAGAVTDVGGGAGNVATDAIWDTAGDLAVGTGANTAAKLVIGAAGGALSRINGAVAWNSGTAFPTAATGDRYWRTDLGLECYYDGTRWLTTTLYEGLMGATDGQNPWAASGDVSRFPLWRTTYDIYLQTFYVSYFINGTNDGSNFWSMLLRWTNSANSSTTLNTITSAAESGSTWYNELSAVGAAIDSTARFLTLRAEKTSAPGTLFVAGRITYRLIVT